MRRPPARSGPPLSNSRCPPRGIRRRAYRRVEGRGVGGGAGAVGINGPFGAQGGVRRVVLGGRAQPRMVAVSPWGASISANGPGCASSSVRIATSWCGRITVEIRIVEIRVNANVVDADGDSVGCAQIAALESDGQCLRQEACQVDAVRGGEYLIRRDQRTTTELSDGRSKISGCRWREPRIGARLDRPPPTIPDAGTLTGRPNPMSTALNSAALRMDRNMPAPDSRNSSVS